MNSTSFSHENSSKIFSDKHREYIEKHNLMLYVEDSISQFLIYCQSNPKVKPAKFLREYFRSVKQGNHVLFRDYNFVMSTAHNWDCAKNTLQRVLQSFHKDTELSTRDYHSLICLLFKDFPFYVTNDIVSSLVKLDAAKVTKSRTTTTPDTEEK